MTPASPAAATDGALERVLRRDRALVLAGLVGATALAWLYLVVMAHGMEGMSGEHAHGGAMQAAMTGAVRPWSAAEFGLCFLMWVVMMVGMMLPGAAPMILIFARFQRSRRADRGASVPTGIFAAGYLAAWTAFSLAATALQWGLDQLALLSPMMVATSPLLGGAILIAAGVFQWTPQKDACLAHCRSPFDFVQHHWRPGAGGAFRMGLHHGLYCLGCCWILMALLFVGGVMNLLWIALITIFVLLEKIAPRGAWLGRLAGAGCVAAGVGVLLVAWS